MAIEPSRSSNVQDDYVLLEQIGQHAGKVFRAQHVREQRAVVVRIWRAPDKAARDRFVELARLARSVRHPVLPAIEAFGYHGDNACYVVTECARGEALDRWADRMGIPSVASAVELFQRVCVGLNAAHRNGLAHDTLHPRNLLVTESDSDPLMLLEPCVLDLGVPAAVRAFPPPLRTARFMAPEQLARAMRERALPTADVRMNVYSCGSLLHYLCTGGAPFLGRTLDEFAHAQAAGQLVPPSRINPQIPIALDAVIMRALAHDPSERFASMAELGHALERVRTGTSASGVRPRVVPASAPPPGLGRFDERPTSEAPRLPVMSTPQRPPAPAPSPGPGPASPAAAARTAPSAVAAKVAPFTPSVAAPAADEAQRRAPAGLFSSAPPAAPVAHETAQPSARRSRRTASHGTGPTDDAQTWRSVRASMLARAQRIGVTLTRAWKRLHPETRRWLGATLTASAAIALALHLAHLRTGASGEVAGAQRRPAASGSERDVRATAAVAVPVAVHAADPEPPIPTRTPTRTPIPIPIPTRTPTPTRTPISASSAPSDSLAAASSLELQRMLKLRARKPMHDAEPESATAIAAATGTAASAQLTVLPREPALEIKPAGPVEERATPTPSAPAEPAPPLQTTRMPADARDKSKSDTPAATKPQAVVPLAAHVRTSDLVVHGSVATSVVRRAIERMTSELQGCYARAAVSAGRNAFGTSHVEIEIDEHGRARDAHAHGSALPGLDACVAQSARNLVADRPPDTGRVQASFELAFTP